MSSALMQQIENILRNPAIDFVWNDRTRHLSHIVPTLAPFDSDDDAATMCGLITSGADILPSYDWCPECWGAEFPQPPFPPFPRQPTARDEIR